MKVEHYTTLKEEWIEELNGTAYLLEHERTKARVMLVSNEDANKVFSIGFRTPPSDDTGVPHIIEHSVLCGSAKFPVKDPFVELAKGSLNTFLNAMTYPDKTVYPVASVNDKDFHNLMDVYLDAVFHPNIYTNDKILKQEGWHYHLEEESGELIYNGVVYNEMKGAYSSEEQQLMQAIQHSVLPDTTYGCDSGGDPKAIPSLTQDAFLDFHRRYYHPSNSYIYLYGNVDMEKELAFIHEEYLKDYAYQEIDSRIELQDSFDRKKEITTYYPLADSEDECGNTYFSYNTVIGNSLNRTLNLAFTILDYALMDVPGAPVKKALVDAGISNDVYSTYEDSILQPFYAIVAKGCKTEDRERFVQVIEDTLSGLVEKGFDDKVLQASLNHLEFKCKEANFGRYPKGLVYGLAAFNSWLYDDDEPFLYLRYNEEFSFLRQQIGAGYFEKLIQEYLLDNSHKTIVTALPKKGMNRDMEREVAEKLSEYKASMKPEEIKELVRQTQELNAYQAEPSSAEDLMKIPMLELQDIGKEALRLKNREVQVAGIPMICHDLFTNGIDYVECYFSLDHVPLDLLPYVSLLVSLFKEVDTDAHSYGDLANEIDLKTGGIGFSTSVLGLPEERGGYRLGLVMRAKALHENLADAFSLMEEILFTSHITDRKRLKEILAEMVSQLKVSISESGHTAMAVRALSGISKGAWCKEQMEGIAFYDFLSELNRNFDASYDMLCEKLNEALHSFTGVENLILSYTGQEDISKTAEEAVLSLKKRMWEGKDRQDRQVPVPVAGREGFRTASKVQYVAASGNFLKKGCVYSGALQVLQVIFSYEYLWIRVRVQGGAYGCMCSFSRLGDVYFTSYRDPNLKKTYEIYHQAAEFVRGFEASDRDMLKYIIGAISRLDTPMTPSAEGAYSFSCYLSGVTDEMLQRDRDEILSANVEGIRALADHIDGALSEESVAVLGDEELIGREKDFFEKIRSL